jgi:hypothetical protein
LDFGWSSFEKCGGFLNVNIYLLLISILYLSFILAFYDFDRRHNKDAFSAVKLIAYFACIELFVLVWFAVDSNSIEELIFEPLAPDFRDIQLVYYAYFFSIIVYLFVSIGAFLGSYGTGRMSLMVDKLFLHSGAIGRKHELFLGFFLYALGVILFLVFLNRLGGLTSWPQYSLNTKTAGLGYLQTGYNFLTMAGIFLIYAAAARKRQWLIVSVFIIGAVFMLGALGQRTPIATMAFAILLIHHYKVKKIRNIFSIKIAVSVLLMLSFLFLFLQVREGFRSARNTSLESVMQKNKFAAEVIQRLGIIERQVVVIGYFNEHDLWYGGLYESLLHAYKPRSSFPDKPPIDTGVYINTIATGDVIYPPVPFSSLNPTSWPDGYLAGYMSCGFIGLILISVTSGFVFGSFYRLVLLSDFAIGPIIFYVLLGFMGAKPLSPYGIMQLLLIIISVSIIGLLSNFGIVYKRTTPRP